MGQAMAPFVPLTDIANFQTLSNIAYMSGKDVSDIESDWDTEDLVPDPAPKQTTVINNNKRSIFLQHKKIKKFSL